MARTNKQVIGRKGEDQAALWLKAKGHVIRETNYWKKWGEIDIVSECRGVLHFVEVKTVTRDVIRETPDFYEPEDNIHPWKRQRLARALQTYLLERKVGDEVEWQVDAISVYFSPTGQLLKVEIIEDICL